MLANSARALGHIVKSPLFVFVASATFQRRVSSSRMPNSVLHPGKSLISLLTLGLYRVRLANSGNPFARAPVGVLMEIPIRFSMGFEKYQGTSFGKSRRRYRLVLCVSFGDFEHYDAHDYRYPSDPETKSLLPTSDYHVARCCAAICCYSNHCFSNQVRFYTSLLLQ